MSPKYVDCTQLPKPHSTRRLQTTVISRTAGTATSSTPYGITVLVRLWQFYSDFFIIISKSNALVLPTKSHSSWTENVHATQNQMENNYIHATQNQWNTMSTPHKVNGNNSGNNTNQMETTMSTSHKPSGNNNVHAKQTKWKKQCPRHTNQMKTMSTSHKLNENNNVHATRTKGGNNNVHATRANGEIISMPHEPKRKQETVSMPHVPGF